MPDAARGDLEAHRRAHAVLRKYATPSDRHGLRKIALNWAVIVTACSLDILAAAGPAPLRVFVFFASALVVGIAMGGLETCAHEATHYTLFRTRRLNNALQILFAAPVLESVEDYRASHLIHHTALGGPADPAMQLYAETGVARFPRGVVWVMFLRPLTGYHALLLLRRTVSMIAACPRRGAHIAAFWIPVGAGAAYFGLGWQLAAFVLCPLFYVLPIILFWAEVLDHGRLNLISPVRAARTHAGPLSLPFYPYGEGYHLVHHLHPGIPGHRLAEAHRELTGAAGFSACAAPPRSVDQTVRELARV